MRATGTCSCTVQLTSVGRIEEGDASKIWASFAAPFFQYRNFVPPYSMLTVGCL